jgi:hypothetical protein
MINLKIIIMITVQINMYLYRHIIILCSENCVL